MTSTPSDVGRSAEFRESRTLDTILQVSAAVAAMRLCGGEALDFVAACLSASARLWDAVPAVPESFGPSCQTLGGTAGSATPGTLLPCSHSLRSS